MGHVEHSQRVIPAFSLVSDPVWIEDFLVARLRNEKDAVVLCWAKRTRKHLSVRGAAEELGLPASHLSNILSGKKYLPHDFRIKFQKLCGNWAIRQYEDRICGFLTHKESPEHRRIRELEAQLKSAGVEVHRKVI